MAWIHRRSSRFWRALTLVLAGLPQLINTEYPSIAPGPSDERALVAVVVTSTAPSAPHRLLDFAVSSGLILLLTALVLVLPHEHRRRAVPLAAGVLALLGLLLGYVGMSALESSNLSVGFLLLLSPFYLAAAATLILSERRANLAEQP